MHGGVGKRYICSNMFSIGYRGIVNFEIIVIAEAAGA